MSNDRSERRSMAPGIKMNNILTALVLGVMAWVGVNIDVIKNDVGTIRTETKLNTQAISNTNHRIESESLKLNNDLNKIESRVSKLEEKDYLKYRGGG